MALGVYGFDVLVQRSYRAPDHRVEAAKAHLAGQGKDYRLSDCKLPLSGDEWQMNCRAKTQTGRTLYLSFAFTPEGTVAVVCEIGTEGCSGQT